MSTQLKIGPISGLHCTLCLTLQRDQFTLLAYDVSTASTDFYPYAAFLTCDEGNEQQWFSLNNGQLQADGYCLTAKPLDDVSHA